MILRLYVDNKSLQCDSNSSGKLILKISNDTNNGLSINSSGELIATRGKQGKAGGGNTIFNGLYNGNKNEKDLHTEILRLDNSVTVKNKGSWSLPSTYKNKFIEDII